MGRINPELRKTAYRQQKALLGLKICPSATTVNLCLIYLRKKPLCLCYSLLLHLTLENCPSAITSWSQLDLECKNTDVFGITLSTAGICFI